MPRRYDREEAKRRILSVCVKLFIERGYEKTTTAEILEKADVTNGTFYNIFSTKNGVLIELTNFVFGHQFASIAGAGPINGPIQAAIFGWLPVLLWILIGKDADPVLLYAVETAIQLTMTELSNNMRELYVESYSFAETSEYIYQHTSTELAKMFAKYLPDYEESDFYELEIGTAGIMRAYMARPCDKYFKLEMKLERFLNMALCAYKVPEEERKAAIEYVESLDIRGIANDVMQQLFKMLAEKYNFTLD